MLFILIGFIFVGIGILFWVILYIVHLKMVKENCVEVEKIRYKRFIELFNKYDWQYRKIFKNSLFYYDNFPHGKKAKIHANIIEFEGVGYQLGFFGYIKFKWKVRKKYNEIKKDKNKDLDYIFFKKYNDLSSYKLKVLYKDIEKIYEIDEINKERAIDIVKDYMMNSKEIKKKLNIIEKIFLNKSKIKVKIMEEG